MSETKKLAFEFWTEDKFYGNGVVARYNNEYYRSIKSHQSSSTFDLTLWKKLPDLPKKDDIQAFKRRTFNTIKEQKISYGTTIGTIQGVVDFLLGYEQYLISKGFTFDRYDTDSKVTQDWFTSAKEFMYWTQHNWAPGSLLTLSPAAEKMYAAGCCKKSDQFSKMSNNLAPANPTTNASKVISPTRSCGQMRRDRFSGLGNRAFSFSFHFKNAKNKPKVIPKSQFPLEENINSAGVIELESSKRKIGRAHV